MTKTPSTGSSARRRLRYGAYRCAHVVWRTLSAQAAAWHIAVAVAAALLCAVGFIALTMYLPRVPYELYVLPLVLAAVYAGRGALPPRVERVPTGPANDAPQAARRPGDGWGAAQGV